jgi:hypothetical protein
MALFDCVLLLRALDGRWIDDVLDAFSGLILALGRSLFALVVSGGSALFGFLRGGRRAVLGGVVGLGCALLHCAHGVFSSILRVLACW